MYCEGISNGRNGLRGSVVAEKLLENGYKVLGLARNEASDAKLRGKGIEIVRGDLTDLESLKRGARETDATIHTAFGHDFANFDKMVAIENNAVAAFAEALAGTEKPLIATNGTAYLGDTKDEIADENYPAQPGIFGYGRYEAERLFLETAKRGVRSVMMRLPFYVYGRGGSVFIPALIDAAKHNSAAFYVEPGNQKVSAVHVDDAANAYLAVLENKNAGGVYQIAAETVTNKQIAESIGKLTNVRAEAISIDEAGEKFGALVSFLIINNQLSSEKARSELNWLPNAEYKILDDIENGSYQQLIVK
ncbi:MAG: NAD-dependent epimerase/dehydratase family protein [Pyrinomonadaceae bacterium]|nr:NAD-dependent epimerase/dehydratase family protein [Pyrinomonadaceae bacterium]